MRDVSCGLSLRIACVSVDAAATLQAYPPGAEAAGLHPSMQGPLEEGIDVEPHAKRAKLSGEQLSCVRVTARLAGRLLQSCIDQRSVSQCHWCWQHHCRAAWHLPRFGFSSAACHLRIKQQDCCGLPPGTDAVAVSAMAT